MLSYLRSLAFLMLTLAFPHTAAAAVWDRENLHAWCIVPFDAARRTPAQRAEMLVRLGIRNVAYDWREQHVAEFEEEFLQYRKHGIRLAAFWGIHPAALDLFRKHDLHPQLWVMAPAPAGATDAERASKAAAELLPAVAQAREAGCSLALYNHGGWAGEPENMAAIVRELREKHGAAHAGIVYNFHHGHAHIAEFAAKWKVMQPYLLAVNLNGMEPDGESRGRKILHLSEGSHELEMMRVITASGWQGPVGLIDHRDETDSEITLRNNLRGFTWLCEELKSAGSAGPRPEMQDGRVAQQAGSPGAAPDDAAAHPLHRHPVNRDRIYNFYAKQERAWRSEPRALLPPFPGLDSGRYGHWGNQNEETWRDARLNDMDCGPAVAGVLDLPGGGTVAKAVCVRAGNHAAVFDPESRTWRAAWRGGFVQFSDVRHGLMNGIRPRGEMMQAPQLLQAASAEQETYLGYYRHGDRTIFSCRGPQGERLFSLRENAGGLEVESGDALKPLTTGGPLQWPQVLETSGTSAPAAAGWPLVVDTLPYPATTPWKTLFFFGGHDFFSNGDIAVCTMSGDVWRVSGVDHSLARLRWKRMAAGLHQPLGLVVRDGKVCVLGRDQITRLHDLNDDGEADFYECLTGDFTTPTGGHDYMCGLECDAAGNFYTVSGKEGVLRLRPGQPAQVVASGFRNPDGLGLAPDGTLTVPLSEGEWTPTSAICQIEEGGYYGYPGPRAGKPSRPPLLWLPRGIDNSAGGQTWLPEAGPWAAFGRNLIHLSYGTGNAFLILRQQGKNDLWQGGAVPLPGDFRSGAHRGRFSPHDGHFYVSGMTGWGTYTPDDGCLHRIRLTAEPLHVPVSFEARHNGVLITFSGPVDAAAADASQHFAQCWNYRISAAYGSQEYSLRQPDTPGHDVLEITGAHAGKDGRTLFLEIPQITPAGQIHLVLRPQPGTTRELFLTVHQLAEPYTEYAGYRDIPKMTAAAAMPSASAGDPGEVPWEKGNAGRAITIKTAAGLQFATRELRATRGERLSLTLESPDVIPHNWVLLKPGAEDRTGKAADLLISSPDAALRHYVPEGADVLCHTRLLNPGQRSTIHFNAPTEPGRYPYLCTFPGHWMLMRGVLIVE